MEITHPSTPMPVTYCCNDMRRQVEDTCDEHPDPFDCPDALVTHSAETNEYGLIIHNGGSDYVIIRFCPWCGTKLPVV